MMTTHEQGIFKKNYLGLKLSIFEPAHDILVLIIRTGEHRRLGRDSPNAVKSHQILHSSHAIRLEVDEGLVHCCAYIFIKNDFISLHSG